MPRRKPAPRRPHPDPRVEALIQYFARTIVADLEREERENPTLLEARRRRSTLKVVRPKKGRQRPQTTPTPDK